MHCPNCGCHVFTVLLDFSKTDNNIHQDLMTNDILTCENCHKEVLLGELELDHPDKIPNMEDNIPNPGTKEAIEMGCLCSVVDNNYGKGYCRGPEGEILFCYTAGCPVHDIKVVVCDESNIGHY